LFACEKKRKELLWNRSFQEQLCTLAAQEVLLEDKPQDYTDDPIEDISLSPPPQGPRTLP
jgi:hypothetical protein